MGATYKGLIFTNHALERARERGLSKGDMWATWRNPDQSRYAKSKDAWIYYKVYSDYKIEVVAKKNEKKEWIVISVWKKPIYKDKKSSISRLANLLKKLFYLS